MGWSSNGFLLLVANDPNTHRDIWVLREGTTEPCVLVRTGYMELTPAFSPDGRWVAYASDSSGEMQTYVRPFSPESSCDGSPTGGATMVSTVPGLHPTWRADGRQVFYVGIGTPDRALAVAGVETTGGFHSGPPRRLFEPAELDAFSVWQGRVLMKQMDEEAPPFTVVQNWMVRR